MRINFCLFFILIVFISCSNEKQIYEISVSSESEIFNKESKVSLEIKLNNFLIKVEDLKFFLKILMFIILSNQIYILMKLLENTHMIFRCIHKV